MEITNAYDKTAINNFLDNKADKTAVQASLTAVDTVLGSKMAIVRAYDKVQTNAFVDANVDDVEFEAEEYFSTTLLIQSQAHQLLTTQ